ncbi:MAG: hypothetical protein IPJ28_23000 [Betaproteobacteria bacterium]|nr:hypothetical protein [Betaproteobacteria bacterium]
MLGLLVFAVGQTNAFGEERVRIGLTKTASDATIVSFGLPLAPGQLTDPAHIAVVTHPGNVPIANVRARTLLSHYSTAGAPTSIKSVLIQFPISAMPGTGMTVEVIVNTVAPGAASGTQPFTAASFVAPESIQTTDRRIVLNGSVYSLTETNIQSRTLFTGTEPKVLATYPDGYLAGTGLFGELMSRAELLAKPKLQGMKYLSDNFALFTSSMMYADYRMNSDTAAVYDQANFEGWLYDRCATYLTAYAHTGDVKYLRYSMRSCSYYSGQIGTSGANQGIFLGKPTRDTKYSHQRGVYLYYALTGDEAALAAGTNMAVMWNADTEFVSSYRTGRIASSANLWTERLLSTSLEGLAYGFAITGNATYRTAAQQIFETAHRHVTTASQSELNTIMQTIAGASFPPQNCWIHSAAQHAEGGDLEPWCSSWMSELIVDPMRAYQEVTGDARVDEVFIRLGRFMRDIGTTYVSGGTFQTASRFIDPQAACYTTPTSRKLVPSYGAGLNQGGVRQNFGDTSDEEHCADASVLMSSAIRALHRSGQFNNAYNVAGLQTEGRSFVALFHELSSCARSTFQNWTRTGRDPRTKTSAELAPGYGNNDPAAQRNFMTANKIGYPSYPTDPQRKLSWWFNTSILSPRMMDQVGIDVGAATGAGYVQGASCGAATTMPPTTPVVFTGGKAGQTITFAAAPVVAIGGSGYVAATASSGLLPTYTSTTPSVCTVSGNRVAAVAQGTCIIAANQAGNANYNAALAVTQSFTVPPLDGLAFSSPSAATFTVNSPGTFTVTATGSPVPALSVAGALPQGITFTSSTGVLAGTPATGTAGDYPLTFTASNGVATNATQSFTLTVANIAPNSYTVTPSAGPNGTIAPSTPQSVTQGGAATFTVTPSTGHTASVSGTCGGTLAGNTFTTNAVTAACTVVAGFTLNAYSITATASPSAGGTVTCTPNPVGHGAASTCTATARAGYTFSAFSGACTGSTCSLSNVTAARSLTATFTPNTYAITTTASPSAGGTVTCTPNPVGHGAASTCTATARAGYTFSAFSGACTGSTCTLSNVTAARNVTANFSAAPAGTFALTVTKSGGGTGLVASSAPGIDCGATCSANFNSGISVALAAVPFSGSYLKRWSGACTGTGACNVTMDAAKSANAEFKLKTTIPRLANISTRMQVLSGNDVLIGGFIIGGAVPKTVVVRARGPSLIPFGIPNALVNPRMDLFSGQDIIATNDNWQTQTIPADVAAIQASGFAPTNDLESAIRTTLAPGAYTAVVTGVGNGSGVGIVEVFEVDLPEIPLINISTRGQVLTANDVMIGGFIIQGDAPQTVIIRARGPSLVPFGIPNALLDPVLQLFDGPTPIATNDDWQLQATPADLARIQGSGFAPSDTREAVISITLPPGAYTAIVTGKNGTTGGGIMGVVAA